MAHIVISARFDKWLKERAAAGRATYRRILSHIDRMRIDNFDDSKSVGDGVSALRLDFGPGYRLYYTRRGLEVVLLLVGGDKSTQAKDISKAREMVKNLP